MAAPFFNPDFVARWTVDNCFDRVFRLRGEVFRQVKNRTTIRFVLDGRPYFIKIHRGVGWREIFKNLFSFKRPVLGASNEYFAIRKLESLGIDTMTPCAFAERGFSPASRESFLVTEELVGKVSLEDFCASWRTAPPAFEFKHRLIRELAVLLSKMHFAGLNHKDCYICHFLLDTNELQKNNRIRLCVLDLHRAEIRRRVPYRLWVKDVAGILFSSLDLGLSRRDWLRFRAVYDGGGLLSDRFWRDVKKTAYALYRKEFHRDPPPVMEGERSVERSPAAY